MTLGDNINSKRKVALAASLALALAACSQVIGCGDGEPETQPPPEDTGALDTGSPPVDTGTDTGTIDTGTDTGTAPDVPDMPTATPQFDPPSGTSSMAPIDVKITSATAGAVIYYTTDGTNPNTSSPKYSAPINITKNTTIKAMALAPGFLQSEIATATYTVTILGDTVQPVTFTPPAGSYENDQTVSLASATPAATICYTVDGTAPTCAEATATCTGTSATYSGGSPIPVTTTGRKISAIACKAGMKLSAVTSATYTLNAASAVFSPVAGTYDAPGVTVTATLATAGATVRYTTNGTDPNCTSIGSTFDFTGVSIRANTVFKAITCKAGYNPSAVQTINYNVRTRPVAANPAAGDVNNDVGVSLTQADEGMTTPASVICWSTGTADPACTGGATPTCTAGTTYNSTSAKPQITKNTTVKVVACDAGRVPGAMTSLAYTTRIAPLVFDPVSGTKLAAITGDIKVSTATVGASAGAVSMRYTTDGTTVPTCTTGSPATCNVVGSNTECTIPKSAITEDKEVKVIACKTDYASATGTATYASATALGAPTITPGATAGTLANRTFATIAAAAGSPSEVYFCFTRSEFASPSSPPGNPDCVDPTSAVSDSPTTCLAGELYTPPTPTATSNVILNAQGQTIKAIACPRRTTSKKSGVTTQTGYTFKVATPTLPPAGAVGANSELAVSTSTIEDTVISGAGSLGSPATSVTFHYTAGATTPADPTCATSGSTAVAGSVPATNNMAGTLAEGKLPGDVTNTTGTIVVKVVACKDLYQVSNVATQTYTAKTADPVLTPSPNASNVITVFPTGGVTVTSPSGTGTKLCFTWDGGTPSCSPLLVCSTTGDTGKMGQAELGVSGVNKIDEAHFSNATSPPYQDNPKSGVVVNAIACRTGLPNSAVVSKTFNFNVSPVVFTPTANSYTTAAGTSYVGGTSVVTSGGFFYRAVVDQDGSTAKPYKPVTDTSAWTQLNSGNVTLSLSPSTDTGGTTTSGTALPSFVRICYRTDGSAPVFTPVTMSQPDPCLPLDPATTICTNTASPGSPSISVSRVMTIIAVGCRKGFTSSTSSQSYNVTPYRHTIDMTVGANDFNGAEAIGSTGAAPEAWVTYDNNNLYFGFRGDQADTTVASAAVGFYLGTPGAKTMAPSAMAGFSAPLTDSNYFIKWTASTNTFAVKFWNGTSWVDTTLTGIASRTSGTGSASFVKIVVPYASVGLTSSTPATLHGEGIGPATTNFPDPGSYVTVDPRSSLDPNHSSKIAP